MTVNELYQLCTEEIAKGNGDRIVCKYKYHLGNSHQWMNGKFTPMEQARTTIEKRHRRKYIELS